MGKKTDGEVRELVHEMLRNKPWQGKWFAILDDVPDPKDAARDGLGWLAADFPWGHGKTLVTSRSPDWAKQPPEGIGGKWWFPEGSPATDGLRLNNFTKEEACAWAVRRMPEWSNLDHRDALDELVAHLECFPLALDQALGLAREEGLQSPRVLMDMLRSNAPGGVAAAGVSSYPASFVNLVGLICEVACLN